jgi:hypothetical protein
LNGKIFTIDQNIAVADTFIIASKSAAQRLALVISMRPRWPGILALYQSV